MGYLAFLLLIGLADLLYNEPLYALTLRLVPEWQSGFTFDSFTVQFLRTVTHLGEGYSAAVIFGLAFVFTSRDRAFYLMIAFTSAIFINKNLKIIYRNPRPYMVHSDIIAFGCSKSFGNPSGHSSLSACFYTTLFLLTFYDSGESASRIHSYSASDSLVPNDIQEPLLGGSQRPKLYGGSKLKNRTSGIT